MIRAKIGQWAEEPFRVFFPLGTLASLVGVMLWPAFAQGWLSYYPLEAHARWMVVGFAGCFVVGFLGTAGPRLLGSPPWRRWELVTHLSMALLMLVMLALHDISLADLVAGLWLLGVLASLLWRFFRKRQDVPPPGLPMAALGLFSAGVSALVLSASPRFELSRGLYTFARLLYFQGLLWLPVIAVAPFLLPRFFGKSSRHSFEESRSLPAGWSRHFTLSLLAGLALIATFACEAWFASRLGMVLRAIVVALYLALSVPGLVAWTRTNGLGVALRLVLPCAAGGWLLAANSPLLRVGMLHLMLIGGAGLLLLSVATRVILGHAERHDHLSSPMRWFHAIWGLVLFTAVTRMTADWIPNLRTSHLDYAAGLWMIILGVWWWKLHRECRRTR
jgi:uncharacterized protein involved in response to NO